MAYNVNPSQRGDRREHHVNRRPSLIDALTNPTNYEQEYPVTYGAGEDEPYDEAVGPRSMTLSRTPEWEPTEYEQLQSRSMRDAQLDAVTDMFGGY